MKNYTREEIENGVREIIADVLKLETDEVKLSDLMTDDLDCDSLDCVDIVVKIEIKYNITIPDNELIAAAGWTVSEVCDYIEEMIKDNDLILTPEH